MRHDTVTVPTAAGLDWKALGYITSIISVLFLGAVAWAKENPPNWYHPALIGGMVLSILGMGFRYLAHLRQKREIREAKSKADRS